MKTVSEVMETEVTTLGRNDTLQLAEEIYDPRSGAPFSSH